MYMRAANRKPYSARRWGSRRKDVVIATKVFGRMGSGANEVGLSRLHIMREAEASLLRLGTDYIDLYQIHGFDKLTPLEETLSALTDLVRQGKVRYIGCSNLAAWQIMKSLGISAAGHLEKFITLQAYYSLAGRELEREIIPAITDQKMGLLVWSPLAGGFLTGKFTRGRARATITRGARNSISRRSIWRRRYGIVDVMAAVATAAGSFRCAGRAGVAAASAIRHERNHRGEEYDAVER